MKKILIFFLLYSFNLHAFNDKLNEKQNQNSINFRVDSLNSISTINFEYNSFVKLYMDSYLIKDQKLISKMLAISKHYFPIFEQKLDKYNLPLELKYLSVVESSLNTRAKSPSGALGLWQFMYPTAKEYGLRVTSYIDERLDPFKSTGENDRVGHEMIIDFRSFKEYGIEVLDIAKRLMDYGFHAPTVSFPVANTVMIEPTESESKQELDKFCDALIGIKKEIEEVINKKVDPINNVLKNAPHTMNLALNDSWEFPYSREKAVFPLPYLRVKKFWPTVRRINGALGDRNLICSCPPMSDY